jgi:formylglycine-generating enzyme required for sulfatase activity
MNHQLEKAIAGLLLFFCFSVGMAAQKEKSPEDLFWASVVRSDVIEEYQLYTQQYPKGKFLAEAWRRIGQLEAQGGSKLQARSDGENMRPGKQFKDCAECPEMIVLPAGSFEMGGSAVDEQPVHRVTLKAFAMGKTEVTQGQWKAVMGNYPSGFNYCGDDCPAERVSWEDAQEFVRKLSQKTGKTYRLPSEAEWEYACRAGGRQEYCGGDSIDSVAWYGSNTGGKTHPAARKVPNAWGLFDMSGNVWEWTHDCLNSDYKGAPSDGSSWTSGDCQRRVLRGGSWFSGPGFSRAAYRDRSDVQVRHNFNGLRVVRLLP